MKLPADNAWGREAMRALRLGDLARAEALAGRSEHQAGPTALSRWLIASAHLRTKQPDSGLDRLREALALDPDFRPAVQDLGAALMAAGDAEAALAAYRRAAALAPDRLAVRSAVLMTMHYCTSVSSVEIADAHRDFGRRFPAVPRPARRERPAGAAIRLGLVSGDFRRHSTASFLPPFLEQRDRGMWHVVLYSNVRAPDDVTRRFQRLADGWVDSAALSDEEMAARIAADDLDVLIDLNGHAGGNRLGVFARRPAPLQATWLDYVHSTGMPQIDLLLTDIDHVPQGEEDRHVERVVRLPTGTFRVALPPDPPPALRSDGPFTFGSFNSLDKVSADALAAWAEILRSVPEARLVIAARALDRRDGRVRVTAAFEAAGIAPERVDLLGAADRTAFLARYGAIDLHLDSFPYSGGLTTLEAVWMGVPTLTFRGDRIAGRHSAAHLRRMGLDRFVAVDRAAYVAAAVALAQSPGTLRALRPTLRARLATSTLTDGRSQGVELAAALRAAT